MSARVNELKRDELIAGRFRVTREIGRGGQGIVYEAHDTLLGRNVALKTLQPSCAGEELAEAARQEAHLLSKVESPHVGAIYDLVHDGALVVLVMEFVQGPTLETLVQGGPLPWPEVATLAVQLARGLKALHGAGIVHRDIKPSNIRLSSAGLLKILDLGVGRWMRADDVMRRAEDSGKFIIGTLSYMSPEQLRGHAADARSDIYGCGSVLYELATGLRLCSAPRRRGDGTGVALPVHPRTLVPGVPVWMDRVIMRAVDSDPVRRFQTARDLLAALLSGRHGNLNDDHSYFLEAARAPLAAYSNNPTTVFSLDRTATAAPVVWGEYWK